MRRLARALFATCAVAAASASACRPAGHGALQPPAACPRDARRGPANRCICEEGRLPVLGACVPPTVGDDFCGPAGHAAPEGCSFRSCPASQRLDVASGACVATPAGLSLGECGEHERPLVESERVSCVSPDATCPRAAHRAGEACMRPTSCPPGTLPDGASCRPVVTRVARGRLLVDVGAWTALALGIDGGPASAVLCQPLAQRPALFGVEPERPVRVHIQVTMTFPDQDVSALSAEIVASDVKGQPLPVAADAAVAQATSTLLELLRSLGGESSAAAVGVHVRCDIGAP